MELVSLFLVLVILSISSTLYSLSYVFQSKPTDKKLRLPPGSTGWPFIGETLEYLSMSKKNCIEKFISERQNKYSTKHFKTSYVGENMVFICSAEGNKFLFSNEDKLLKRWLPRNVEKIFEFSLFSETKGSTRKMISTLFSQPDALEKNVAVIDAIAKEHLKIYWDCQEEVKVHPLTKKYTFTINYRLILNVQDSETNEEMEKLFNCIMTGIFSLPINVPGTKYNRAIKAARQIREKLEGMVKQRKIEILENCKFVESSKDLLSLLIWEKFKDNEEVIESDIADIITLCIIAAYDNTSNTIATVVKYLAELPEVYEEVRREQMKIANTKGPEEPLNLEDIKNMGYSSNVVSEVLRLQPSGTGTFREAVTDFSFGGFLIPKGWKLHRAIHGTHKSAEYFPEPDKFDPSRFEGNNLVPFSYVPFGGGPHICPGREYARLQILVFLHYLIKKFRWEKVFPDETLIRNPILVPAKRLPIRLYPHDF